MKKTILAVGSTLVLAFLLMQLIPYRISNPSRRSEPTWDSSRTRALAVSACFDCHSNEVRTPWYGKVAPISWWLTNHVNDGRAALNFSEWHGPSGEGSGEAAESVREGSMPPSYYTWFGLHSGANLTPAERNELADGLERTLSH
jgi:mono/diheme cytochrome c family protein